MSKSASILCFGNPLIDSYLLVTEDLLRKYGINKGQFVIYDDTFTPPEAVKKIVSENKFTEPETAGSSVNTIKGISFLGGEVALLGQYGDDKNGEQISKDLEKWNIKNYSLVKPNSQTSELFICITPDAQRTVLGSFQDSFHVDSKKADLTTIGKYDYSFFESYSFADNPEFDAIYKALEKVEEYGKKFIFALSNIVCVDRYKDIMTRFFNHPNCKIVIGNSDEFMKMFDHCSSLDGVVDFLFKEYINTNKLEAISITDGSRGAWVLGQGKKYHVCAPEVENLIDTTGAGDYFAAGFIHGILSGYPIEVSAEVGNILAGDVISRLGISLSSEAIKKAKDYLLSSSSL